MPRLKIKVVDDNLVDKTKCIPAQVLASLANTGKFKWYDSDGRGNCYEVAGNIFIELAAAGLEKGWLFVQATCKPPQGHHAWLEADEWAIDFASGQQLVMDIEAFYEDKAPEDDLRKFTFNEFYDLFQTEEGRKELGIFE